MAPMANQARWLNEERWWEKERSNRTRWRRRRRRRRLRPSRATISPDFSTLGRKFPPPTGPSTCLAPHVQPPLAPEHWTGIYCFVCVLTCITRDDVAGFCFLQSLAEVVTALLWIQHDSFNRDFGVDIVTLIHMLLLEGEC